MNTLEAFQMRCQRQILNVCWCGLMSPMQRCFSDLVCQPLATSYVIDAYLCLAMSHTWIVPAHDALPLTVDIPTKAERQRPTGEDHRVALAASQQGSDANTLLQLSIYAAEIWDCEGPRSGAAVHSDYATTTMMMKDNLCQKWRVKLIFKAPIQVVRNRDCWVFENHWRSVIWNSLM